MNLIDDKKFKFDSTIKHFKEGLNQIRTGRANPELVENLLIDYYGNKTPLIQLASISTPDARSLLIQPFDKNSIKDIEKAIQNSDLGLNPVNEGNVIRLPIPPLTEERRNDLAKAVHEKSEKAKVSIRNVREEIWKNIKENESSGKITEDDMFDQQKELQKTIDNYNSQIKDISEEKENNIKTI